MPIISLSVNEQVLGKFDEALKRRGYASRSEAFREAMKDFVDAEEWAMLSGRNALIMAVIYDRDEPKIRLSVLRHKFVEIRTMLHTHLDEVNCLEVFIAEGVNSRLKEIVHAIRGIRGIKQIKFINTVSEM